MPSIDKQAEFAARKHQKRKIYAEKNRELFNQLARERRALLKTDDPKGSRLGTADCPTCLNPFKKIHRHSKFCSKECKSNSERRHQQLYRCAKCGNEFKKIKSGSYVPLFCSRNCQLRAIHDCDPIHGFRKCKWCEAEFPVPITSKIFCCRDCAFEFSGYINTRARIASLAATPNPLTRNEWKAIIAYFGGRCAYCHQLTTKPVMDHVEPVSKGGLTNKENIVPACWPCNASKCDVSLIEFLFPRHFRKKYALRKNLEKQATINS